MEGTLWGATGTTTRSGWSAYHQGIQRFAHRDRWFYYDGVTGSHKIDPKGTRRLDSMVFHQRYGSLNVIIIMIIIILNLIYIAQFDTNVSMINYLKCVTEPITETYPICGWIELFCPSLRREIWAVHQNTEVTLWWQWELKSNTGFFLISSDPILTQSWEMNGMVSEKVGLQLRKYLLYVDW